MKLKLLKKSKTNKKIKKILINNIFLFFIQHNNTFLKNKLKYKFNNLNLYLRFLKNKSNFIISLKTKKIINIGQTWLISLKKCYNFFNIFSILYFNKIEKINTYFIKYKFKLYNNLFIKKLLFYNNIENLFFSFFFNIYKIKSPNKNLIHI